MNAGYAGMQRCDEDAENEDAEDEDAVEMNKYEWMQRW